MKDFINSLDNGKNKDAAYIKKEFIDNAYSWMMDEDVEAYVRKIVNKTEISVAFKKIPKNILDAAIINAMKHLLDLKNFKKEELPVDAFYYFYRFIQKMKLLPETSKLEWLFDKNADWMNNDSKYTFKEDPNIYVKLKGKTLKSVLNELSSKDVNNSIDVFAQVLQSIALSF